MIAESNISSCPECGCARVIDAGRGMTCTACGLVLDETPSFVVSDQRGKDGVISSHSVLHANTTTLVGAARGRGVSIEASRLARTQQRAVSYDACKESRIYHRIVAAATNAQLPAIVVDHAVHAAREIVAAAPRGSLAAGPAMAAALAVFVACKRLGIIRPRDEWAAMAASLGIPFKPYSRNLLHLRALGIIAGSAPAGVASAGASPVVNAALAALREACGPGDHLATVRLVHGAIARALVGMREDSAAAVTAYLAGQMLSPAGVPLTLLAKTAKFRAASMYNAVKRVLCKLGVVIEGPLSKARLGVVLRSRVLVGGGVVKEVPEPVPAMDPEAPEAEAASTAVDGEAEAAPTPIIKPIPVTGTSRAAPHPARASTATSPSPGPRPRKRAWPPVLPHPLLPPELAIVSARGNACRLRWRRRAPGSHVQGTRGAAGPPRGAIATGLGPPVPVAAWVVDGG